MKHVLTGIVIAGVGVALLGWWLTRGAPSFAPAPAPPLAASGVADALPESPPPRTPAPVAEAELWSPEGAAAARREPAAALPKRVSEMRSVAEAAPSAAEPPPAEAAAPGPGDEPAAAEPPMEALLKVPPRAPAPGNEVEWAGKRKTDEKGEAPRKPGARIEYSRENVTEGAPMQDERRRTDVGVSVPVGEAERVRVKGGVRVDEREGTESEREVDKTPTVGVELKF
jgi:hypothetical protein